MSATMSADFDRPKLISGVCGDIARRAAVPSWMPRLAFLIFFALHWVFALILYVVLAKTVCARKPARLRMAPGRTAPFTAPYAPPSASVNDVKARLSALDERLRHVEAAAIQSESELRRAFRDLERGV